MNKYLETLEKDPLVYYIYQSDLSIYSIPSISEKYIIIVDANYQIPDEFLEFKVEYKSKVIDYNVIYDNVEFKFYEMQEWFNKVLNSDIEAWECSCLNKKFVKKEYVKLLLTTDPLKLRLNFDAMFDPYVMYALHCIDNNITEGKSILFNILKQGRFSSQIIENHKIINFNEVVEDYTKLIEAGNDINNIYAVFLNLFKVACKPFLNKTEGILQKSKTDKIIQNETK